jgi:hypothetical protein
MSRKVLDVAVVLLATSVLLILTLGGIDYDWGGLHIRLHSISRPLALLALALGARLALAAGIFQGSWGPTPTSSHPAPSRLALAAGALRLVATRGLLALLLAIGAVYAHYHVRVCGGLDSYGYVSTASLIASGHLTEPQPLVEYLPFESASSAVAPLGYVAGPDGHTQVPRFPLGLPMVMALFKIFGPMGPFFVPLLMAYATMALGFLLGREPGVAASGLFAAAIVASDPLLVDYAIQPMSDVPAACWLVAAVWLRIGGSERTRPTRGPQRGSRVGVRYVGRVFLDPAILAGACAGMAFLTRPALLIAAIALGLVTLDRSFRETARFGATLAAFIVVQMAVNLMLYGSVGTSGYGPASYMFEISRSRIIANASNFAKWLTYSHTAVIWLLWPAALAILRRRRWAWQISAVAAAAALPYLFYLVFDDWESSRFLLPAIVLVLILAARALSALLAQPSSASALRWRPASAGPLVLFMIALGCTSASHRFLQYEGVYRLGDLEAKYALAGEWIKTHTPDRAVVLAGLHSGSIRLYGLRPTIRWDQIPADKLSPTLRNLEAAGYQPYLALDVASEPPLFAERFRSDPRIQTEQIARIRVVNIYRFVP